MSEEKFRADHFDSMEELLEAIKVWIELDDVYSTLYDDFNRFFDCGAMLEMYYYIKDLQQQLEEQKKLNEEHQRINGELREENKSLRNKFNNSTKNLYEEAEKRAKLEDNWNKLKEWLKDEIRLQEETYKKYGENNINIYYASANKVTLEKMQELESGDSDE